MSNKDLFLEYIRAYNAKDVSGMVALFDDTCLFENVSGGKSTVRTEGRAALELLARQSAAVFASREQKVISLTEGQGRVVAEIEYHGIVEKDFPPHFKRGERIDLRGVSVAQFESGKIVRLSDYS